MVEVVVQLSKRQTSLQDVYLVDIGPDVINYIQQDMQRRSEFIRQEFVGLPWLKGASGGSGDPRKSPWDDDMSSAHSRRSTKSRKPSSDDDDDDDDMPFTTPSGDYDEDTECCICMDKAEDPKALKQCGHIFCHDCISTAFSHKPVCPVCGVVVGKVQGDQPKNGKMSHSIDDRSVEGYPNSRTIVINYYFPDGIQEVNDIT